jgi:uncharacterized protein (TIGR02118 family)
MIIRTGLIKNRDGVGKEAFAGHWLKVHGPLASRVPDMMAYSQNHIVERHAPPATPDLHRVDGLSQLYFTDIPTMARAMNTPEQRACVEDIKGFLSQVTIVIQRRGKLVEIGEPSRRQDEAKLMGVLLGDPQAAEPYASRLTGALTMQGSGATRLRMNPVVDRGFVVDESVPRGEQVVGGILEVWFQSRADLRRAVRGGIFDGCEHLMRRAALLTVREHVLIAEKHEV